MLSEHSFWVLKVIFFNGKYFCAIPFRWNFESKIVTVHRINQWKCIAMILFLYGIFTSVRLIQSLFWYRLPLYLCITQIYFTISSFYFGMIQLAIWLNYDELAAFWTKFLQFDAKYSDENFNGTIKEKIGLISKILVFLSYSHAITQGAGFWFIRTSPNFIYSLILEHLEVDYVWLRILFTIFEGLIMFYSWSGCFVINAGILYFTNNVEIWNDYVSLNGRKAWRKQKILYYRSLQLLVSNFSSAYSRIALPGQEFAVLFGGIICLYSTIQFYGKVHILIYLTMPISLLLILYYESFFHSGSASVYTSSERLLKIIELQLRADAFYPPVYWRIAVIDILDGHRRRRKSEEIATAHHHHKYKPYSHSHDETIHRRNSSSSNNETNIHFNKKMKLEQSKVRQSFPIVGISIASIYVIQTNTIMTFGSLILNNAINLLLAD